MGLYAEGQMRTPIPEDVAAEVVHRHYRTCCVCNIGGRPFQIHHIDDDPTNQDPANLAVLCLECHDLTQIRGGFGRKLKAPEVIKSRDDWVQRVAVLKRRADNIIVEKMTVLDVPTGPPDEPWEAPSEYALAALINSLPDTLRAAYEQARPQWDTGNTHAMNDGSRLVIDVLEQAWVQLAKWYPPKHFGNKSEDFIREYIGKRTEWHYAIQEPEGGGTGGTIVSIIAYGSVASDLEAAVADTVCQVSNCRVSGFDFSAWKKRWEDAKKTPEDSWQVRAAAKLKGLFQKS